MDVYRKIRWNMDNFVNYFENPAIYKRELYRAFKRIFSGTIKESFLIDMVNRVESDPRYGLIFLGTNDPNKLFSMDKVAVGNSFNSSNICKMIVIAHYANTASLNDYERGKQQDSNIYKEKLTNEVIKMFGIEKLAVPEGVGATKVLSPLEQVQVEPEGKVTLI